MLTIAKASAGAGKTFLLAKTYIGLLFALRKRGGKNVHRHILAVTFTIKATAEMKQRIIQELYLLANGKKSAYAEDLKSEYDLSDSELQMSAQSILYDILQDYSACMVNNIDAFFQQIIRSFAHELNLPGAYNLELDTDQIEQAAVDELLFNVPKDEKDPTYRAILQIIEDKTEAGTTTWNPTEQLYAISKELHTEAFQLNKQQLSEFLHDREQLQNYRDALYAIIKDYENGLRSLERRFNAYMQDNSLQEEDFSRGKTLFAPFHYTADDMYKKVGKTGYATLIEITSGNHAKAIRKGDTHLLPFVQGMMPLLRELLEHITGEVLQRFVTAKLVLQKFSFLALLDDIRYYIDIDNQRLNRLPITQANTLLSEVVGRENDVPFMYEKVGIRLHHFLMDEFQDTSSMQWNNFLPLLRESLATDNANLIVGDVKQSIYRWRNSNYELLQSGVKEVLPNSVVQTLTDNWRSDYRVVECNNSLLKGLAVEANNHFNERYNQPESPLYDRILSVYADVEQTPKKDTEQGYVQVQFFASDVCDNITDEDSPTVHTLPNREVIHIISDLRERGAMLSEIALLVRKTKDAVELASYLQDNGIPVISQEGLLLSSSACVQLLIAAMQYLSQPNEKTYELLFCTAYYRQKYGQNDRQTMEQVLTCEDGIPFREEFHTLATFALYQMVQALEDLFAISKEDAYIAAFNNVVFTYIQSHQADLYSFLDWWARKQDQLTVPSSSDNQAIQILTIHKSKGLEFDYVIIPYLDWEIAEKKGNIENLLWVKMPQGFPSSAYNNAVMLPVLPVPFGNKLSYSLFSDAYWKELQSLYIDNLNLVYVAFTRAKRELYVIAPSCDSLSQKAKMGRTMGDLLYRVLESRLQGGTLFEQGEKTHRENRVIASQEERVREVHRSSSGHTRPVFERLHLRLHRYSMFSSEHTANLERQLDLGLIMHQLLQKVKCRGDETSAIEELLEQGVIVEHQRQQLYDEFTRFWELVSGTNWFAADAHILCEQEVLLPDGGIRRPDRLVFFDKHAIVIDYKFGNIQLPKYEQQVRSYMRLLQQMGYTVEGYLCYVSIGMLQAIEI